MLPIPKWFIIMMVLYFQIYLDCKNIQESFILHLNIIIEKMYNFKWIIHNTKQLKAQR